MAALTIASLVPALLDIHADAQNAHVLAVRARWQGHTAEVVDVATATDAAGLAPDLITIGAGFDADAREVLTALESFADDLRGWVADGASLLAVGLGWELLATSLPLSQDDVLTGLGLFSGHSVPSARHVGTIAVDSSYGRLVGYEYHLRDLVLGPDETPLGTVVSGAGNLSASGRSGGQTHARPEGAVRDRLIGTGIRGPVLARNPALADALIAQALGGHGVAPPESAPVQKVADDYAERANRIVLEHMRIGDA